MKRSRMQSAGLASTLAEHVQQAWAQGERLRLADVARRAGCAPRRVRHLIQRGLVPKAAGRGRESRFDQRHVRQVMAVQALLKEGRYRIGDLAELLDESARWMYSHAASVRTSQSIRQLRFYRKVAIFDGLTLHATETLTPARVRAIGAILEAVRSLAQDELNRRERVMTELARLAVQLLPNEVNSDAAE